MMKNVTSFVFAALLGLGALTSIGCGGSVEQPQTQASAATKAPVAPNTHGVVKMFGEALGEVALRPEQRTELEKLAVLADTRHAAMASGKKELMLALADQIEKGTIDKAALQPKIDRIVADFEKGRPDDHAALARMHAILDAEQRNAFVDALEARFKGKHHGGKHHGEAGEHGHKGKMGGLLAMKQLSDDLKLTDDQKARIMGALEGSHHRGSFKEGRRHMGESKKVLESFRTDKFDPGAAAPSPDDLRARAATGSTHLIGFAEKVLPVLTPEQRKIAADKLRTLANSGAEIPFGH
jgi:Spy/CpxP family protein refolding chaperone